MSEINGMTMGGGEAVAGSIVLRSDAPLVGHTQWLAKALSEAKTSGRGFVLLTPNTTKITRSLSRLLSEVGAGWIVEDGRGGWFVGDTGQRVSRRPDGIFEGEDSVSDHYAREGLAQDRGGIFLRAEALRPRRITTTVGHLAEAVCTELTGSAPIGWGVQEPVTQPWSVKDISSTYSREKAAGHFLHFVGPLGERRLTGSLQIQKPRNGVVEHVEAALERTEPLTLDERVSLAHMLHGQSVRWGTAFQLVGGDPGVVAPFYTGAPVPAAAVFGPEALKGHDPAEVVSFARSLGAEWCEVLGDKPKRASLAVILADTPSETRRHPAEILDELTSRLVGTHAAANVGTNAGA
ncbi:DUF6177 family protein [Falsarthrobacter nasiphocae]|uniref:Uncharacterized protein n=1 Tax=Falsarthrobacter nasiphocae TaxID=189863 RepID=A0AAE4C6J7_9MICC|nr:DUF6177 family protein [Falsarthrobacter nasiphocae]MDR6892237.1 hypothetical protein [Falsarthrobacter nasiphocae]